MSSNKFAEQQLKKHGWKEGSGLGKEQGGIKEAIRVKIKNDTAGIGHNCGDEFTFHWWDHVFNKAAGSISVEDSEEGVALKKSANNGPISNKKTKSYDNKAMLYGKFVKAATLSNGNYESQNNNVVESDSEDEKEKVRNRLVSEKALEMCEGMTAHKGARHGLKLSGKLVRVQEQERLLLESMKRTLKKETTEKNDRKHVKGDNTPEKEVSDVSDNESKNKQKKKKRKKNKHDEIKSETPEGNKKEKKKKDNCTNELRYVSDVDSELLNKKEKKIKEKKKAGKNNGQCDENEKQQTYDIDSEPVNKKKKKKRKLREEKDDGAQDSDSGERKSKKRKNIESNETEVTKSTSSDSAIECTTVAKKSKKKRRKD